jgi:hypothetical protein
VLRQETAALRDFGPFAAGRCPLMEDFVAKLFDDFGEQ